MSDLNNKDNKKTMPELMNKLTSRLKIPLDNNEIVCPTCKGLRMVYKQVNEDEGYIEQCRDCYNGKLYVCPYCGKANNTDSCNCEESSKRKELKWKEEQHKKNLQLFEKAKKIKFNDYKGYFIINERVVDSDDVSDWLYELIQNNEEIPEYLWATTSEPCLSLDLQDIIQEQSDDNGYEDMYNNLDTSDENLQKSQEYLDKWYKKQGDRINVYTEDYSKAILLDDVIKEIREKIKCENNESEE